MEKRVYIVSLNFNPGHVSHMMASYRQFTELGYKPCLYVDGQFKDFVPVNTDILIYGVNKPEPCCVAMFLFPSFHNIMEIIRFKRMSGCKVFYVFHEPLDKYASYRKAGFSWQKMLKLRVINYVNTLTVKWSDIILLPSRKAIEFYNNNPLYNNPHCHYLPLMYDDENDDTYAKLHREYFSYIGTVASDHSFEEYLQFVNQAIRLQELSDIKFLIATRSSIQMDERMRDLLASKRLVLIEGKPLSDEEINKCYASSLLIWNAYERSTQSGVLAKAFMFGTPAIVLKKNLSEFVSEGKEVVAIDDNTSYGKICQAVAQIMNHYTDFTHACRSRFLNTFYYGNYNKTVNDLIQF